MLPARKEPDLVFHPLTKGRHQSYDTNHVIHHMPRIRNFLEGFWYFCCLYKFQLIWSKFYSIFFFKNCLYNTNLQCLEFCVNLNLFHDGASLSAPAFILLRTLTNTSPAARILTIPIFSNVNLIFNEVFCSWYYIKRNPNQNLTPNRLLPQQKPNSNQKPTPNWNLFMTETYNNNNRIQRKTYPYPKLALYRNLPITKNYP